MELIERFFINPGTHYFLFGPRGTGKTTWLNHIFKKCYRVDLLKPAIFRELTANPERLEALILANPAPVVIIDEIQKCPDLLDVVHYLIEQKPNYYFILTGSSARKIKRSGVNLLGGRALHKTFHPFLAAELKEQFNLKSALTLGLLPIIWSSKKPSEALDAYIALYLKEEIQQEGLVRNIGHFTRFLTAAAISHAQVLNLTNIARECQIERKVVEGYISILYDLLIAFQIPVFSKRPSRATISHPKFYLFDAGVYQTLRPKGLLTQENDFIGITLEGLVAQHLKAYIEYSKESLNLYYWRTVKGVEVDFILYGEKQFIAIEVKLSAIIKPIHLKGLKKFFEEYPEAIGILLYTGEEKLKIDNIYCLPIEKFLKSIKPNQPIIAPNNPH